MEDVSKMEQLNYSHGILVILEVSKKQDYIFRTNVLAENIGASLIIRDITEELPLEDRFAKYQAETLLIGGGKSLFILPDREAAYGFVHDLTVFVLKNYPGVELFTAQADYPENALLMDCVQELYQALEAKKAQRLSSFGISGYGIADLCRDTGLPKEVDPLDPKSCDLSGECYAKLHFAEGQDDYFNTSLLPKSDIPVRFPKKFEELGSTQGVRSYIAVIVIDGNRMGDRIRHFREDMTKRQEEAAGRGRMTVADRNAEYKTSFRSLSEGLDKAYEKALRDAIQTLADSMTQFHEKNILSIYNHGKELCLPVRPLIRSGDDICLVCDARIGVRLASMILDNIESQRLKLFSGAHQSDNCLHACAGVALVKVKYPFFRAHELAEELCNNAKAMLARTEDASAIDFQIVQGEISGSLSEIRRDQYCGGKLTNKPFYLHHQENGARNSLSDFEKRMVELCSGMDRRLLKEYREELMRSRKAALEYAHRFRKEDVINDKVSYDRRNGDACYCVDFDVIEMMDIYHFYDSKNKDWESVYEKISHDGEN